MPSIYPVEFRLSVRPWKLRHRSALRTGEAGAGPEAVQTSVLLVNEVLGSTPVDQIG